ncbi:hypothetical protein A3A60_03095 [Candidatus Curtissbacteria bacterium RIFCSPLOWO2_01_FULL_42_26]|uniref:R3H domain-containing protein n=1 Tax=Candidatus Curtissbacteria bacterium RIFCSPLOWO2_01_FULL_42_26 TaxID=1797729 RepID=A0A1F5I294_9BACT|nr:MAG: hypothetical protein A3A60_03095 [Candidatus Curtissbacteria bacterium RIFCSPLOWO2_01_FULL_42_26]
MAKVKLDETKVAENVKELIEHLGVSATAEISKVDNTYFVDIISEDSSLLIGKHGANLEALQFVLAVRLKSQTKEEDFELFVDVDGWRKQKEERLQAMAKNLADKVAESGKDEILYNLKPSERRVIHSTLTEHPKVTTLSEGEGESRYLVIKPK